MAFNIDNVRIVWNIHGVAPYRAYIEADDVDRLQKAIEDGPELCFLYDLDSGKAVEGKIYVTDLQWSGECSSRSFDFFEAEVVPTIKGEIVALVSWESGERTEIWHIKDGELSQLDMMNILKNPDILSACLNYDQNG